MNFTAAIDDSGDLEYLSILIGEREKVKSIAKLLPPDFKHMTSYDEDTKKNILSSLNFKGNVKICCIKFGYSDLRRSFQKRNKATNNNKYIKKFYNTLAIEAINNWKILFKDFLYSNRIYLNELVFEVDNDVIKDILKRNGIRFIPPTRIHKITDCIVHANFKNWPVEGIFEYNTNTYKTEFHDHFIGRWMRG